MCAVRSKSCGIWTSAAQKKSRLLLPPVSGLPITSRASRPPLAPSPGRCAIASSSAALPSSSPRSFAASSCFAVPRSRSTPEPPLRRLLLDPRRRILLGPPRRRRLVLGPCRCFCFLRVRAKAATSSSIHAATASSSSRGRRGHGVERRQRKRLGGRPSLGDGGGGSGTRAHLRRRWRARRRCPQHGSVARVRVRQRVSRLDRRAQQVLTLPATRFHAVLTSHGVLSLHKSTNRQRREATASSSPSVGLLLQEFGGMNMEGHSPCCRQAARWRRQWRNYGFRNTHAHVLHGMSRTACGPLLLQHAELDDRVAGHVFLARNADAGYGCIWHWISATDSPSCILQHKGGTQVT
ncbi:hypothetical protein ACP70R_027528 [Stipagrostis hirtigluma subsp. patula]